MEAVPADELDYIHFLIAAQKVFSNTEATKRHLATNGEGPARDTYTRLLHRIQPGDDALLRTAAARGFQPDLVGFDSWCASLQNLKLVRQLH